jgi:probable rRNA maturation factor
VPDGGLGRWLAGIAPRSARGELAIALVSDARMRALNRSYRRKDCATDVLSFVPDDASPPAPPHPRLRQGYGGQAAPRGSTGAPRPELVEGRTLGDLVIATGVAKRQAREAGHSYQTELRVLALHGLLHLLGYDHEDPADKGRMARMEARLRLKGRLKAGLIQRTKGRLTPA